MAHFIGPPKHLSTAARDALGTVDRGTIIYNTDTQQLEIYTAMNLSALSWQSLNPQYVTNSTVGSVVATDGKEIFYDVGVNGVVWHLRYNAGIVGSNKWNFVGGPALASFNNQSGTCASASFTDLTVSGLPVAPSVTVPLTGTYEIGTAALADNSPGNAAIAPKIGGSSVDTNHQALIVGNASISGYQFGAAITAEDVVKLQYSSSSGTAGFDYSRLWVRPILVSLT